MKKMGFSVLGLVLVSSLVACPAPVTPPVQVANGSPISGMISNWQAGKTATLYGKVISLSSGTSVSAGVAIGVDGSFSNLVMPTPTAAELGSVTGDTTCGTVVVNPSDAKQNYGILSTDSSSTFNGDVHQANTLQLSDLTPEFGSTIVRHVYVDKDVTINGSCSITTGNPKYTYNFNNVSLIKGWNILSQKTAAHDVNSTAPIVYDFSTGAVSSDIKFLFQYPDVQNLNQARVDFAKKLSIKWDAVANATGYSLEFKASTASQYSAPITVASNQAEIPGLTPNTNYDVRVKTLFGTNSSYGTSAVFGFSTATLNPDGLNILLPAQGTTTEISIAPAASKNLALEFERGASCTQALSLSIDGSLTVGSNPPAPVGAASSTTISGSFAPNNTTENVSTLSLTVGSSVPAGTYTVSVNADGCPTGVSNNFSLTVP